MIKAVEILESLTEKVKTLKNEIITKAQTTNKQFVNEALAKLDDLIEDAQNNGTNVDECVVGLKDQVDDIAQQILNDTETCTNDQMDEADEVISFALNLVKEIAADADTIDTDFDECQRSISCIIGIILRANKLIISVPLRITEETVEVNLQILQIIISLNKCLMKNGIELSKKILPLIAKANECISNKIIIGY